MLKTHKIALDPNNVQATQFAQHCGYARVAYNHVLADFKDGLATDEWRSHIELNKRFNAILKLVQFDSNSCSVIKSLLNIVRVCMFVVCLGK